MSEEETRGMMIEEKTVPIVDCPYCGKKDVPASHTGPYVKGTVEVNVWSCPFCDAVLNLEHDFEPKKWITIKELEEMGWVKGEDGK